MPGIRMPKFMVMFALAKNTLLQIIFGTGTKPIWILM